MEWTEVPSALEMDSMCTILSFWFSPFIILFKVLAGMCVSFDKVASVSYTHLDVYKRQVSGLPPIPTHRMDTGSDSAAEN